MLFKNHSEKKKILRAAIINIIVVVTALASGVPNAIWHTNHPKKKKKISIDE